MHDEVLEKATRDFLLSIKDSNLPEGTYLAGRTAVALQIGHRRSADLDFFTPEGFMESQWEQKLADELGLHLVKKDWQTIIGHAKGVKFSLFGYKYPLIESTNDFGNIKVASLKDLAAMKLDTIVSRGTKRDFIDLYFLGKELSIQDMIESYQKKYGNWEDRQMMIKKSLIYFEDAEKDEMPEMLIEVNWEEVKKWLLGIQDKE